MHSRLGEEDYYNNKNNLFDVSYDWRRLIIASKKKKIKLDRKKQHNKRAQAVAFSI